MNDPNQVFSVADNFSPVTRGIWLNKISEDLKGEDFNKNLAWKTDEGFDLLPFYLPEDLDRLEYLSKYQNLLLNARPDNSSYWIYREKIEVTLEVTANRLALEAINSGARSIDFDLAGNFNCDLNSLLNGLFSTDPSLHFSLNFNPFEFINHLHDYLNSSMSDSSKIRGGLNYDPIKKLSLTGKLENSEFDLLAKMIRLTSAWKNFQTITINTSYLHNSFANTVQELAFTLNILVDYLDQLTERGLTPGEILDKLEFSISVGTDFFMEIAKLRAMRILLTPVIESYSLIEFDVSQIKIHAENSQRSMSLFDPHVNILRNTTQAMSAILGGCDSLSITPFNCVYARPDGFSNRISRNISNILREESYFDKVADPVSGAYFIETITHTLIEKSFELFREIESQGGYMLCFAEGIIQEKLAVSRKLKMEKISSRMESIIGVNQYANPSEIPDPADLNPLPVHSSEKNTILREMRAAEEFESIRLNTILYAKKAGPDSIPVIYLAQIGNNKPIIRTMTSFSISFFNCAGFKTVEGDPDSSIQGMVDNTIISKSPVVVMCGSVDDYLHFGIEYASLLKSKYKCILLMAGDPGNNKEKFLSAGIDDYIHLKSNAVEMLKSLQVKLNMSK